jgi:hypothetical protein
MKQFFIVMGLLLIATLIAYPWKILNEADSVSREAGEERRKKDVEEDPNFLNN